MTETAAPPGLPRPLALLARLPPVARPLASPPRARGAAEARRELRIALLWGAACHGLFGLAVAAMAAGMWTGMTLGLGTVPAPWSWAANLALIAQFPLVHSLLLTDRGRRALGRLGPAGTGPTLATTTYALIASVQLLALFLLWTPSGIVWWRAEGWEVTGVALAALGAWGLLVKASWDAGAEVQSGLLGWLSLARGARPRFPPMPVAGSFRTIRQPIYLGFALSTWAVPVWTPDQLLLAATLSAYCLLGPRAKERRFARMFGADWAAYRARTPYMIPRRRR